MADFLDLHTVDVEPGDVAQAQVTVQEGPKHQQTAQQQGQAVSQEGLNYSDHFSIIKVGSR